ncbi:KH domain protein [Candidatus Tiddalikarchaeum anstoanum]|nr:KH domain protein [Candidatus Tiddalikarchaeum anstoanum]
MNDFTAEVRIPQDRVAVLIGSKGSTKKDFETRFEVSLNINSEGAVSIIGKDSLKVYLCEKAVKAIGRGFNPEIAKLLEKDNYEFELIDISDYARNEKDVERLRGRVIGREGKSKGMIERLTGSYIIVYGKTVSVISDVNVIEIVHHAIEMLLKGAMHVSVFTYLEKENQKRKREVMLSGENNS